MADMTLICRDCGDPFIFSDREQAFFASKDYKNPSRCYSCRNNNKPSRPRRPMYPAICAGCHQTIQVPFSPDPNRPFYCRECNEARFHWYTCESCGEEFKSTRQLDPKRGIRCSDCYKASLNTYVCDICGGEFTSRRILDPNRSIRCRDCNEDWKRGECGNSGYCCECGSFVVLPFIPDPDKWIRCDECRADWEGRQMVRRLNGGYNNGIGGSSRVYGSGPMAGQHKPTSIPLGGGMSMPIPRSTYLGPGVNIPRGGPRRGRW